MGTPGRPITLAALLRPLARHLEKGRKSSGGCPGLGSRLRRQTHKPILDVIGGAPEMIR
jgi:hypothetical protein